MLLRHSCPHGALASAHLCPETTMTPHKDYGRDPRPPAPLLPPSPVLADALQVCHPHAAGIDIGEAEHWVAGPPGRDPPPRRRVRPCTAALPALPELPLDRGA